MIDKCPIPSIHSGQKDQYPLKCNKVLFLMKYLFLLFIVTHFPILYGAGSVYTTWKAGYFNASFQSWYGHGFEDEQQRIIKEIMNRTWIIIRIDSLVRVNKKADLLSPFPRWTLVDNGHTTKSGTISIQGTKAYLNLADSLTVISALTRLWGIKPYAMRIGEPSGIWLYSLHYEIYDNHFKARGLDDTLTRGCRLEELPLFLYAVYDAGFQNTWYQHEIDGYYHRYFGLFISNKDVLIAQDWFLNNYGWNTTITSHYLTPAILKGYLSF